MIRPLALIAASAFVLPGCLIVVDHDSETRWAHDDETRARHIGVYLSSVDETAAAQLGLDADHATTITAVIENSPAEQAGLKRHDIITAVDGDACATQTRIRRAIREHKSGETVTFTILRQGQSQAVAVAIK